MDVYMYAADLWCEDCGLKICNELTKANKDPEDPDDEYSYDSDDFPKGPFPDGGGESDSPQHCAAGAACINAEGGEHKHGCFLENPLTNEGYNWLYEEIIRSVDNSNVSDCLRDWVNYYDITFESLFDWADENRVVKKIAEIETVNVSAPVMPPAWNEKTGRNPRFFNYHKSSVDNNLCKLMYVQEVKPMLVARYNKLK